MKLDRVFVTFFVACVPISLFLLSRPAMWTAATICLVLAGFAMKLLDTWRRVYVVTLLLFVCSMSSSQTAIDLAYVARYAAVGLLVLVTWASPRPEREGPLPRLVVGMWLVAVVSLISVVWSIDPRTTLLQAAIVTMFAALLHGLMTRRWVNDSSTIQGDLGVGAWVMVTVFTAGIVGDRLGLVSSLAVQKGYQFDPYSTDRFRGVFANANSVGYLSALTLLMLVGLWWGSGNRAHLVGIFPTAASLFLCESRTALVAAGIGVVWVVLRGQRSRMRLLGLVIVGAAGMAFANAAGAIHLSGIADSLNERFTSNGGNDLLTGRNIAWSEAITEWQHHPIFGIGFGAGPALFRELRGNGQLVFDADVVHNSYLQWLLETGLFGIIPVVLLTVVCVRVVVRGSLRGLGLGLVPTVLVGLSIQVTESAMFGMGQAYPYIFWLVVAAAAINPQRPAMPVERQPALTTTRYPALFSTAPDHVGSAPETPVIKYEFTAAPPP